MTVEVVTVWKPIPTHPKFRHDYVDLIALQRRTAHRFGHRHTVVTDTVDANEFDRLLAPLPDSLMKAMIAGVIARLSCPVDCDIAFLDADAIVARDLTEAFDGTFDLGLTRRKHDLAEINNGAMYVAQEGAEHALRFFRRAIEICGDHWGGDQEAISQAAAPVPEVECVEMRDSMRLAFLSMVTHNIAPKLIGKRHESNPFVVHFKGEKAKPWARTYAEQFVL